MKDATKQTGAWECGGFPGSLSLSALFVASPAEYDQHSAYPGPAGGPERACLLEEKSLAPNEQHPAKEEDEPTN